MDYPLLAPDKKNLNCAGCGQQEVNHLCPCRETGLYLCDACVTTHVSKYRGKSHNILPIQTLNYYKMPGYVEAFRERTNEKHDKAIEELRENTVFIDGLKAEFAGEIDRLKGILTEKAVKVNRDFDELKRYIESESLSGLQEMHQKVFEPSPDLTSPIAKALWKYVPGSLRLLSCNSPIPAFFETIDEYVTGLKVVLTVDFQGGTVLEETRGGSDVVVVRKQGGWGDRYVGQRGEDGRKEGYGRELNSGEVFEGWWKQGERVTGKLAEGGRVTIGKAKRREKTWNGVLLAVFCVALAAYLGSTTGTECICTPAAVLTAKSLFEEGPLDTSLGLYWGEWNSDHEKHGFGQLIFNSSGDIYTGQWSNDQMDGKGRMTTSKGDVYDGDWSNGLLHGFGSVKSSTGTLLLGQFCEGVLCGLGVSHTPAANRTYIGEFERGFPSGKGTVYFNDQPLFSGVWKSGIKAGFGVEFLKDRLCFGTFMSNHLHGDGTCLTFPGTVYSGGWNYGKRSGNGTAFYPAEVQSGYWLANAPVNTEYRYNQTYKEQVEAKNGETTGEYIDPALLDAGWLVTLGPIQREYGVYYGQVNEKGQRQGYGVQNYSDGSRYEGYWKHDVRGGKGKMVDKLGRTFEGDWVRNTFTGCGIMVWNEVVRQGTWVNRRLEGLGMERHHSFVSIGEYVNNTLTGLAARFDSKGGLSIGTWSSDKLHGKAIELYRNDDLYFGHFSLGTRSGPGTYLWKSGDLYIGEFSNNSRNGKGRMTQGSEVFEGSWTNGAKSGEGVCKYCSTTGEKCRFETGG